MPFVAAIPAIAAGVSAAAGVAKTVVGAVQTKKAREAAEQAQQQPGNALNPNASAPGTVKMEVPVHLAGQVGRYINQCG